MVRGSPGGTSSPVLQRRPHHLTRPPHRMQLKSRSRGATTHSSAWIRTRDLTIMSRAPPCERRTQAGTSRRVIPAKQTFRRGPALTGAPARVRAGGPSVDPREGWRVNPGVSDTPAVKAVGALLLELQFRAGAGRRIANTGRWLKPIRRGIGASSCATRSAPNSNSCAEQSRSYTRSSTRRTTPSKPVDSASRTQARHSGSSTKSGRGAGVACGRRYATASCCSSDLARPGGARPATRRSASGSSVTYFAMLTSFEARMAPEP